MFNQFFYLKRFCIIIFLLIAFFITSYHHHDSHDHDDVESHICVLCLSQCVIIAGFVTFSLLFFYFQFSQLRLVLSGFVSKLLFIARIPRAPPVFLFL